MQGISYLKFFLSISFTLCIICNGCKTEEPYKQPEGGKVISREVDMSWWNDARYGMFIHYGIYSVLGGEYIGKNVEGTSIHFQSVGRNNDKSDSVKIGAGAGAEFYTKLLSQENLTANTLHLLPLKNMIHKQLLI